ncbi:zn-finger domain-containing protein [Gigaspora margarita]|uniref:Zn-finger domain-containing protein n=1 Tax=Gigaspora margarita TaxID=4874 RepID=A0A8H3X7M8_GIGMA|nr:zn-finger domain-containing protein [Gigaspora margarita]
MKLRNHENMQYYYNKSEEQTVSIESVPNIFWKFKNINIYEATVIDRMHHLDLGLFNYQITFTYNLLKELQGTSILDKLDNRLANIPRFLELKIFKNGIQSLSRMTANKYLWNNMYIMSQFEEFDDQNLKDFKNLIINWAQQFINIFQTYTSSELKFPKLHSWVYHTIGLIRKYGALNGFSTETYESLHKDFVKAPYYLTNKQNIEIQLMKMVQRQAIATKLLSSQSKNIKTISPYKFTNLIWTFSLNNAQKFINQKLKDYNSSSKIYFGLENFLQYLTIYFNSTKQINLDNYIVKIYSSITLENGSIIQATDNFYGKAWYSNVAVAINTEELFEYTSDQGICYRQWYDIKSEKNPYYYGCPRLQLNELFNVIDIEAIRNQVHVIPRFDKTNEYLVNKYIF